MSTSPQQAPGTTVQQAPGIKRTDLQEHDLSSPGRVVIQNRVELGPEAPAVRHWHPGEEITRVPATALMVPAERIHSVKTWRRRCAELATCVVEKAKPFLVVVDD